MRKKFGVLAASLAVALVPYINSLESWPDAVTPVAIGALLGIVGGVVLAWYGESPNTPSAEVPDHTHDGE